MRRLRPRLTYANVISTVCLFLLLAGGTAFAASEMLAKESVGTKELKKGAVTAAKVKPGTLLAKDFAPKQLPEGPRGPTGAVGPKGPTGEKGATGPAGAAGSDGSGGGGGEIAEVEIEDVSAASAIDTTTEKEVQATCPSGKVLGGGYVLASGGHPNVEARAVRSYSVNEGTWLVRALNSGTAELWQLSVVAVCLK